MSQVKLTVVTNGVENALNLDKFFQNFVDSLPKPVGIQYAETTWNPTNKTYSRDITVVCGDILE